jgi:hypothetical protein
MAAMSILAGPSGLQPGDELTFFYPSTEWSMGQAFDCFCGTKSCRGRISGAKHMSPKQLEGIWLNAFIRDLIAERDVEHGAQSPLSLKGQNGSKNGDDHAGKIGNGALKTGGVGSGAARGGPTSRELSGEMGGDTFVVAAGAGIV